MVFIGVPIKAEKANESYVISQEMRYTIKSQDKSILTVHKKIWVGNEKGKKLGTVTLYKHQFCKVKSIKAQILDKHGKKIKKLRKKDILILENTPGYSMYAKDKKYIFGDTQVSLPYIFEYEYTLEFTSLFFWPDWFPQNSIPVRESTYILTLPKGYSYHTFARGPIPEPVVSEDGRRFVWRLKNIPAFHREYRAAPEDTDEYMLNFSPDQFVLDGIEGFFNSWNNFGMWYDQLSKDQYDLDPATVTDLQLSHELSSRQKIREIYSYIQDKTRYVAIELGIHGWKPHTAQSVCVNKYGDCKDLTFFFISLLKQQGINAYPALILTRDEGVINTQFPSRRFNHVITFIPMEKETLWVDCTSRSTTIDDLPPSVEGCNALVIKDGIGTLIQTPVSKACHNQFIFAGNAELGSHDTVILKGSLKGTGNSAQALRSIYRPLNNEERRKIFIRWLSDFSPSIDLINLRFINFETNTGDVTIRFECIANKYVNQSRNRLFINPSFFRRVSFKSETPDERKTAVFYNYPLTYLDTLSYSIPENYTIEVLPDSIGLNPSFGHYSRTVKPLQNRLVFARRFQINQQRIELDDYEEYYQFMKQIEKADRSKIVLVKKD